MGGAALNPVVRVFCWHVCAFLLGIYLRVGLLNSPGLFVCVFLNFKMIFVTFKN